MAAVLEGPEHLLAPDGLETCSSSPGSMEFVRQGQIFRVFA